MNDIDAMKCAIEESLKSDCKKRKCGAVLRKDGHEMSRGHNIAGVLHECSRMNVEHASADYNECPAIHAEIVAIAEAVKNTFKSFDKSTMFLTGIPCMNCAKTMYQVGIRHLVMISPSRAMTKSEEQSIKFLDKHDMGYAFIYTDTPGCNINYIDDETRKRRNEIEKTLNDMFHVDGYEIKVIPKS